MPDAQLTTYINELLASNTETIKAAEEAFNNAKQNPKWLVPNLVEAVEQMGDAQQHMAALLLRKAVTAMVPKQDDTTQLAYLMLDQGERAALHAKLLQLLAGNLPKVVTRSIIGCVSAVGSQCLESEKPEEGHWPELVGFLVEMAKKGEEQQVISAINVFSSLHGSLKSFSTQVGTVLSECLSHSSLKVKVAAVTASLVFIVNMDDSTPAELRAGYVTLLPKFLSTAEEALRAKDEDSAQEILEGYVEMINTEVEFLLTSGHTEATMTAMLQIAENVAISQELRHLAVEAILAFTEADARSAKKASGFLEKVVSLMIDYMKREEDADNEWLTTGEEEDDEEYTDSDLGAEGLDRLALSLGAVAMERFAGNRLLELVNDQNKKDWRNRWAAIKGLAHVAEGCKRKFEKNLAQLTMLIVSHVSDEHPKVRHQAGRALAQFCTDFGDSGEFQGVFHQQILSSVDKLLQDPVLRVRHVGASIIVNFCEEADSETYKSHVPGLMNTVYNMLMNQDEPLFVKEQLLASVSGLSENLGSDFAPYYDKFMPVVKVVFNLPEDPRHQEVKGKAIECASFMCCAVGQERILQGGDQSDCKGLLDYMLQCTTHIDAGDRRHTFLRPSWGRMATVAQDLFEPYLSTLMPRLLEQCSEEDARLLDDEEVVDEREVNVIRLAMKGQGERRLAIHTNLIEEKAAACEMLETYLQCMPQLMFKHVQPICEKAIPLVSNPVSETVRMKAAALFPLVMQSAKANFVANGNPNAQKDLSELLVFLAPRLIEALQSEADLEAACREVEAFAEIVKICGHDCIPADSVQTTFNVLKQLFQESLERRKSNEEDAKKVQGDEDEEEKLEEQQNIEEVFLITTSEAVGQMIKTHQAFIGPFVSDFLPQMTDMLDQRKYGQVGVKLALCVFDDFIEHGREHAMPFFHDIIRALQNYAMLYEDTAQSAAYGLGVCVQYATQIVSIANNPGLPADFFPRSLEVLNNICKHTDDEEWGPAICNAVSALLKFVKLFPQQVPEADVMPAVCRLLPVGGDNEESAIVHEKIFRDYVATKSPHVVGPNGENLNAIKQIAQELLSEEGEDARINEETRKLIIQMFA